MISSSELREKAVGKRDSAKRALRLAHMQPDNDDRRLLLTFAAELEAEAAALELQAGLPRPPGATRVMNIQQQVQQQQQSAGATPEAPNAGTKRV